MKSVSLRWGACEQAGVIGPTMDRNATTRDASGSTGEVSKSWAECRFSAQLPVKVSTGRRDDGGGSGKGHREGSRRPCREGATPGGDLHRALNTPLSLVTCLRHDACEEPLIKLVTLMCLLFSTL